MAAFNTYAGVPGVANAALLDDMLRREWGFPGIVVSDFGSIDELDGARRRRRRERSRGAERSAPAPTSTCRAGPTGASCPASCAQVRVPEAALDRSVRRVLALKEALGLFRDPYGRMDPQREAATLLAPAHRAAALALAEKSLVLVKNAAFDPAVLVRRPPRRGDRATGRCQGRHDGPLVRRRPSGRRGHPGGRPARAAAAGGGRHRCRPGARTRPRPADIAAGRRRRQGSGCRRAGARREGGAERRSREPCRSQLARRSAGAGTGGAGRRPADGRGAVPRPAAGAGVTGGPGGRAAAGLVSRDHGRCRHRPYPVRRERAARPAADHLAALGRPDPGLPRPSADRPAGDRAARSPTPRAIWTSRPARCSRSGSG